MTGQTIESHVRAIRELIAAGRLQEAARRYVAASANARAGGPAALANAFSPAARSALQTLANTSAHPNHVRLGTAVLFLEGGNAPEAERALRPLAAGAPSAPVLTLYGRSLTQLGRAADALASFDAAVKADPSAAEAHYERARLLQAGGRLDEARTAYAAACRLAPHRPDYWLEYGNACKALNQLPAAVEAYSRAVAARPVFPEALNNRATVFKTLGRPAEALADFGLALTFSPRHLFAYLNRGALLTELKQLDLAKADFEKALAIAPEDPNAHYGLGEVLHQMGRHEEAIASLDAAILLAQRMPFAFLSKGNCLQALGLFEDAIAAYAGALETDPTFVEGYVNWGTALQELGRHEEAIAIFDRALQARPDFPGACWNKANSLLCLGLSEEAWRTYEQRHRLRPPDQIQHSPLPLLGDQSPAGRSLLLHWDQRFGDIIMALRYIPEIERSAARCIWQIAPALRSLVANSYPDIEIVEPTDFDHQVDYRLPITSLPYALRSVDASRIPTRVPYLRPTPALAERWAAVLSPGEEPVVALVWRGQPVPPGRDVPLEELEPLFRTNGVRWCALQLDLAPGERDVLQRHRVQALGDRIGSFDDTAAILQHLDLLITIDTSVAHLAGALDRPCWVLVKYGGDWRWHLDGATSAWYPTARIYRQTRPRDWRDAIDSIAADLRSRYGGAGMVAPATS